MYHTAFFGILKPHKPKPQPIKTQPTYLVRVSSAPMVLQVAPESHWVPQRLVACLHVQLEAQAVLQPFFTASLL
jgi:hypothetical protein